MYRLAICVTGMPGAGKSVFVNIARTMGIPVIVMGDVVREEAEKLGLPKTRSVLSKLASNLRKTYGIDIIARICIRKIKDRGYNIVVIDGLRSIAELNVFKKHFDKVKLVFIHSPPGVRFRRLLNRRRSDDPTTWESFVKRDIEELRRGLGALYYQADIIIPNVNITLEEFKNLCSKTIRAILHGD